MLKSSLCSQIPGSAPYHGPSCRSGFGKQTHSLLLGLKLSFMIKLIVRAQVTLIHPLATSLLQAICSHSVFFTLAKKVAVLKFTLT